MNFDSSEPGEVKIDICDYISNMVDNFREYIKKDDYTTAPVANNIYEKDNNGDK